MNITFEQRPSDSPLIEQIWRSRSETSGPFISTAGIYWMMVVTHYEGKIALTVRGPESKATPAYCPEHGDPDSEFFGIVFKVGTFMPHLPPRYVAERNDAVLADASSKSFWLRGSAWQFPTFDNADTFIDRLVREDLLSCDPVVMAALQGHTPDMTVRAVQARFLRATGLTHSTIRQIERARSAVQLLQQGVSILDTVYEAGYFDQPHLTRSLKRYMGQTPAQIVALNQSV